MSLKCLYCESLCDAQALKCQNCSAPLGAEGASSQDFRACPFCKRKLLALGSPACNFCGKRLPEEFIKTRKEDLRRLQELQDPERHRDLHNQFDAIVRRSSSDEQRRKNFIFDLLTWKG
jgi:hypothetical protein